MKLSLIETISFPPKKLSFLFSSARGRKKKKNSVFLFEPFKMNEDTFKEIFRTPKKNSDNFFLVLGFFFFFCELSPKFLFYFFFFFEKKKKERKMSRKTFSKVFFFFLSFFLLLLLEWFILFHLILFSFENLFKIN